MFWRDRKRIVRAMGLAGVLVLATGGLGNAVLAQETTTETPAPPGEAEAVAARVDDVAAAGHSQAEAHDDADDSSAHGGALEIGGEPPPSEQFGGTQEGPGQSEGSLLDTGESELGRVQVTPWRASVTDDNGTVTAEGASAVLSVVLGPGLVTLGVLQSQSTATHSGQTSTGESSSDGAFLNVGGDEGVTARVLHAEASSSGEGSSYLVGLNDTHLVTSDDANGQCAVDLSPLLMLSCLSATGGTGEAAAQVVGLIVGPPDTLPADVVGAEASGQPTAVGGAVTTPPAPADVSDAGPSVARGGLAATGAPAALAAIGIALAALGGMTFAMRRRIS